jgi:protease I
MISTSMARVLMIVAQNGFRDEELLVPKEILEKAGHKVMVASLTRAKALGSRGAVVQPDMAAYEANAEFFEAVVIVGGPGSPALAESEAVTSLVRTANGKGKIVAAICLGPMTLAKAGVVSGRNVTIYPDRKAIMLLRESAARYTTQGLVVDGNIVTADGPANAGPFGEELARMLKR